MTALCVAGAVAGGFLGQALRPYAFGLPLGFVFAAAGAKVLLSLDRSRDLTTRVSADTTRRPSTASPVWVRLLEAVGWGGLGSVAVGIAGLLGLILGFTLWQPQQYSQFPVAFLLLPLGGLVGFVLAAGVRLAQPRWTAGQMLFVVLVLSISYAALMVGWGKAHAQEANIRFTLQPEYNTRAVACSSASCPTATPPWQWTVEGRVLVQEVMDGEVGARIDSIDLVGWEHVGRGRNPVSGPQKKANTVRYSTDQIVQTLGANHVAPGGTLSGPVTYHYRTTTGGSRLRVHVLLQFTDDNGHRRTRLAVWNVE